MCAMGIRSTARTARGVNGARASSTRTDTASAYELQVAVAHERAGQEARLAQDLEAVADAEHRPARARERAHVSMIGEKRAMAPQRR